MMPRSMEDKEEFSVIVGEDKLEKKCRKHKMLLALRYLAG